ncbi:MAG TPA: VWA domain-containing protein [Solirubrobacter sp.]|nr:VWA domain-containing protein [Solirubrobacter sp.]
MVAAILASVAVWPSAASAAIQVNDVKVDSVDNTSSPPGAVLPATIQVSISGGTAWRSTRTEIGGTTVCTDTADRTSTGTYTASYNVTAPRDPGSYDVTFTAFANASCAGTSASRTLIDGVRVTTPYSNPDLEPRCGGNVMLVLDESGSIASSHATDQVRSATRAFLNALSGTGAAVSIVDFSTTAARPVPYTTVTPESIANVFEPYLTTGYDPSGWTNWQAAFQTVREANTQGTRADLVVFMTDGDPTARNRPGGGTPYTNLTAGDVNAMRAAVEEADLVKYQGSHVFALGVGSAVTGPESAARLTAISGFDEYPSRPFGTADYTLVKDFSSLQAALRVMVTELCQSSVTVTKLVDEGDGVFRPDAGWRFTASLAVSAGDYEWLQPAPPPAHGPTSEVTDDSGVARFQWSTTSSAARSTLTLAEDVAPGYAFVDAQCTVVSLSRRARRVVHREAFTQPSGSVELGPLEYATCTVRNRVLPGTIEIEKRAAPQSAQPFAFTGSLGAFSLVDSGTGTSGSKTFTGLAPGTYTVGEDVPDGWALSGIACVPVGAAAIAGTQATITLAPNAAVVCTFHDTRIEPPAPPEPQPNPGPSPTPLPPAPAPSPGPPPAQILPAEATQLRVVKSAPRRARIGDRVAVRLTVTNVGSVPATDVRLTDIPSAALHLTGFRGRGARVFRGNAIWRIGTLAPGESRTVRASAVIAAGALGLRRNLVLATAVNANLVSDRADVRIAAARARGGVTG